MAKNKADAQVMNGDKLSLEAIEEEEDILIVNGVLNGALGVVGDIGLCFGDGVLASSCVRSMNNYLDGMIVILGFLVFLEVEANIVVDKKKVVKSKKKTVAQNLLCAILCKKVVFLMLFGVTAALIDGNAAQSKLVLL
ncbi:hypothetical protein Tco_0569551 [Tanacetum coccineum]